MSLTNDDVKDILALLDATRFNELHLETGDFSLSLRRDGQGEWVQELAVTAPARLDSPAAAAPAAAASPAAAGAAGLVDLPSPLLGTFYRAPKPGAPAYVEVGSEVGPETVVGLIEVMKLMNSVYAGTKGRVREICVKDAQFVEQDAVLVLVEPAP